MNILSLRDLSLKNKKVLMRVDFNVPMDDKNQIADPTRIVSTLSSIKYILSQGASLVLMSHLGRPKDKRVPELTLKPCAEKLAQLLGQDVLLAPDCIGPETKKMVDELHPGQVLLLENLRFHPAEEHPEEDEDFVKQLSSFGDIFVNDAFGTAHRAHASTAAIAKYFKGRSAAGFLMEKEIKFLGDALQNPKRPFYAILGGSKISSKCGVIEALMNKADAIFIGGGMTYTFLKAQGIEVGNSIHEDDFLDKARELLSLSGKGRGIIVLPTDIVVADRVAIGAQMHTVKCVEGIPNGYEGVDIGPDTVEAYAVELRKAATLFWNGPVGVFEIPAFAKGTNAIAHIIAQLSAVTIVGGGDSIAAINAAGVSDKITHLSTGGGASLEYIEFGTLPGIDALKC